MSDETVEPLSAERLALLKIRARDWLEGEPASGRWIAEQHPADEDGEFTDYIVKAEGADGEWIAECFSAANATYIAAVDPWTMLALLADRARLEARVDMEMRGRLAAEQVLADIWESYHRAIHRFGSLSESQCTRGYCPIISDVLHPAAQPAAADGGGESC